MCELIYNFLCGIFYLPKARGTRYLLKKSYIYIICNLFIYWYLLVSFNLFLVTFTLHFLIDCLNELVCWVSTRNHKEKVILIDIL